MNLLLDTHVFLWWILDDDRLSASARASIQDPAQRVFFSVASGWEIAIKARLGKIKLPKDLDAFVAEQLATNVFEVLPILLSHALYVHKLPNHHRDPFDRMLVAQALETQMTLLTNDKAIRRYRVKTRW